MAAERVFGDPLGDWKRSSYCGEPRANSVGSEMTLFGWVRSRRDHGGVIFVDLRDRSGICQVVFRPEVDSVSHEKAKQLRAEDVIGVRGALAKRSPETINPELATGEVELVCRELRLLNASAVPPFPIEDETDANENTRLKYRYLDLRRPQSLAHLLLRYRMTKLIRDYLDGLGFIDVETPVLTKSTPEGARDYLVPSRIYHGKFYALPQSPQLFKQILMIGGLDRYFVVNVDHHLGNEMYGDVNWFDGSAAACGEMVADIIDALGVAWTREIAAHLFLAVSTDTGSFRYGPISARTFDLYQGVSLRSSGNAWRAAIASS